MAEINIRLIYNLETGKKDIYIDFESDADALPIEHEEIHREIVEKLIGTRVLARDETGEVVVGRVEPQTSENHEPGQSTVPERQGIEQ